MSLRICRGLLRPGAYLAFTDAVWCKENPLPEVEANFDFDYPTMGKIADVPTAIERVGLSLLGHFTLLDEVWWDDFYAPMEQRIGELRAKCADDAQALAVLDKLAHEPAMHRRHPDDQGVVPILIKIQRPVLSTGCVHEHEIPFSRENLKAVIPGTLAARSDIRAQDGIHSRRPRSRVLRRVL